MSTRQVLNIDYKNDDGLILEWNYTDFSNNSVFFRHILVLYTNNREEACAFAESYISKIRAGDLYTVMYLNGDENVRQSRWKQKLLSYDQNEEKFSLPKQIKTADSQDLMKHLEKQYDKFSEPIVACIFTQNTTIFENRIQQKRYNNKYDFITAIFTSCAIGWKQNVFSSSSRVTKLSFNEHQNGIFLDYFLKNVYLSNLLWVRVSIESLNGAITSSCEKNWQTVDFNTIERVYHGPSIKYYRDYLKTLNLKNSDQVNTLDLSIKLQFESLSRQKYTNSKRLFVDIMSENYAQSCKKPRTHGFQNSQSTIERFQNQSYTSQTILMLELI